MSATTVKSTRIYTYCLYASNGGSLIYQREVSSALFDNKFKISRDLSKAKSKPKYWLTNFSTQGRNKQPLTGLFKTSYHRWFYGDINKKKDFLIFEFRANNSKLVIYHFENFKPVSPKSFLKKFITR